MRFAPHVLAENQSFLCRDCINENDMVWCTWCCNVAVRRCNDSIATYIASCSCRKEEHGGSLSLLPVGRTHSSSSDEGLQDCCQAILWKATSAQKFLGTGCLFIFDWEWDKDVRWHPMMQQLEKHHHPHHHPRYSSGSTGRRRRQWSSPGILTPYVSGKNPQDTCQLKGKFMFILCCSHRIEYGSRLSWFELIHLSS